MSIIQLVLKYILSHLSWLKIINVEKTLSSFSTNFFNDEKYHFSLQLIGGNKNQKDIY